MAHKKSYGTNFVANIQSHNGIISFEGVGVDARVWQVRSWMVAAGAHYVANLRQI